MAIYFTIGGIEFCVEDAYNATQAMESVYGDDQDAFVTYAIGNQTEALKRLQRAPEQMMASERSYHLIIEELRQLREFCIEQERHDMADKARNAAAFVQAIKP